MKEKEKYYLGDKGVGLKQGDIIYFDMPPFCSGEYKAVVHRDTGGLYIHQEDNYFSSCRDGWRINQPYWSKEWQ